MMRFCLILVLISSSFAFAQPAEVNRILRTFDFEERGLGNAEDIPMNWSKVEGPGLPHYVNGRLTTDRARSGKYSFRFDLNGVQSGGDRIEGVRTALAAGRGPGDARSFVAQCHVCAGYHRARRILNCPG